MKTESPPDATNEATPVQSLTTVLGQSERAKALVEASAEELSSVNAGLKREIRQGEPQPGVQKALEGSEAAEDKVQEASDVLEGVNRALEGEVKKRHALEDRLALATKRGDVARDAALHDPLTGLPNRTLFNDRLEQGLAQAARHGRSLAVMFVDLNAFKSINDSHGHAAGDSVLRAIAARLESSTRSEDTVSRLGGDEFLYLLIEVPGVDAVAAIAEKIVGLIEMPCEVIVDEASIQLSVKASVGISMYPKDGGTAAALIASADKAMYVAKNGHAAVSFAV